MKRALTAAVAVPVVILVVIYFPDWLFACVVGFFAAVATEEFLALGAKKGIGRPGRWFLLLAALVGPAFLAGAGWVLMALSATVIALMAVTIFGGPIDTAMERVGIGLAGVLYCSLTLGFLVWLPRRSILLLFMIVWLGDTAAYYGGRVFGRHLLAPKVSPKKTVEGAIAGFAVSIISGTIGGALLIGGPWLNLIGISALTAIVGQLGDLAESVLKRSVGVKDSSSILPGHGGILDRLDSLFFAVPVFYWLLNT